MSKLDLRFFDILSYLEDLGIPVHEEGKNISEGWIGIQCPFCDDISNHLGINLDTKVGRCWKCKTPVSAISLIMMLENISYGGACERLKEYPDPYYNQEIRERNLKTSGHILPREATKDFSSIALNYLINRNFTPTILIPKYDLYCTNNLGKYKFRIVIPIIINYEIVGFTSRDYTDRAELRYRKCSIEESRIHHKEWLYNIDTIKDKVLIVEGPTDVWRMGDGCISPLTSEFSNRQIEILSTKKIKEAYFLFDSEPNAQAQAKRMANNLSAFIPHVEVLELASGDPGGLDEIEAQKIMSEIF